MKNKSDRELLEDILDAIERIEYHLRNVSENQFSENLTIQDAVIHQIQIIGEVGRNVSDNFQDSHPEIPWSKMIGMRNKIVHDYSHVDMHVAWGTAKQDIPQLRKAISKLLKTKK